MTSVPIRVVLSDLWADLSASQKFIGVALVLLMIGTVVASWVNTFQSWSEVGVYENQAAEAEKEKEAALELASEVAATIVVREEELAKVEVKRNEKKGEVKRDVDAVARDRAEYDRAVRERLPNVPSSGELCRRLAALGHPCR